MQPGECKVFFAVCGASNHAQSKFHALTTTTKSNQSLFLLSSLFTDHQTDLHPFHLSSSRTYSRILKLKHLKKVKSSFYRHLQYSANPKIKNIPLKSSQYEHKRATKRTNPKPKRKTKPKPNQETNSPSFLMLSKDRNFKKCFFNYENNKSDFKILH